MENLFVYGTLKKPEIQKEVIGRVADLTEDSLKGYKQSTVYVRGENFTILINSKNRFDIVFGSVMEITGEELRKIDEYETDVFKRKMVVLNSGKEAWVYVK